MKNAFLLVFLSQILFGCVVASKAKEAAQGPKPSPRPQPSASIDGQSSGKPIVLYYEVPGWTECAMPSLSYEQNLKHKTHLKPLKDVNMPMWGLPFKFTAFYYYESMDDGYMEYYIVTDAYTVSKTPASRCFELVFEKPHDEEICEPEKITQDLRKWFLPNRISFKDSKKITKAAHQLPMTLIGCYEGKNLDIILSLKEAVTK